MRRARFSPAETILEEVGDLNAQNTKNAFVKEKQREFSGLTNIQKAFNTGWSRTNNKIRAFLTELHSNINNIRVDRGETSVEDEDEFTHILEYIDTTIIDKIEEIETLVQRVEDKITQYENTILEVQSYNGIVDGRYLQGLTENIGPSLTEIKQSIEEFSHKITSNISVIKQGTRIGTDTRSINYKSSSEEIEIYIYSLLDRELLERLLENVDLLKAEKAKPERAAVVDKVRTAAYIFKSVSDINEQINREFDEAKLAELELGKHRRANLERYFLKGLGFLREIFDEGDEEEFLRKISPEFGITSPSTEYSDMLEFLRKGDISIIYNNDSLAKKILEGLGKRSEEENDLIEEFNDYSAGIYRKYCIEDINSIIRLLSEKDKSANDKSRLTKVLKEYNIVGDEAARWINQNGLTQQKRDLYKNTLKERASTKSEQEIEQAKNKHKVAVTQTLRKLYKIIEDEGFNSDGVLNDRNSQMLDEISDNLIGYGIKKVEAFIADACEMNFENALEIVCTKAVSLEQNSLKGYWLFDQEKEDLMKALLDCDNPEEQMEVLDAYGVIDDRVEESRVMKEDIIAVTNAFVGLIVREGNEIEKLKYFLRSKDAFKNALFLKQAQINHGNIAVIASNFYEDISVMNALEKPSANDIRAEDLLNNKRLDSVVKKQAVVLYDEMGLITDGNQDEPAGTIEKCNRELEREIRLLGDEYNTVISHILNNYDNISKEHQSIVKMQAFTKMNAARRTVDYLRAKPEGEITIRKELEEIEKSQARILEYKNTLATLPEDQKWVKDIFQPEGKPHLEDDFVKAIAELEAVYNGGKMSFGDDEVELERTTDVGINLELASRKIDLSEKIISNIEFLLEGRDNSVNHAAMISRRMEGKKQRFGKDVDNVKYKAETLGSIGANIEGEESPVIKRRLDIIKRQLDEIGISYDDSIKLVDLREKMKNFSIKYGEYKLDLDLKAEKCREEREKFDFSIDKARAIKASQKPAEEYPETESEDRQSLGENLKKIYQDNQGKKDNLKGVDYDVLLAYLLEIARKQKQAGQSVIFLISDLPKEFTDILSKERVTSKYITENKFSRFMDIMQNRLGDNVDVFPPIEQKEEESFKLTNTLTSTDKDCLSEMLKLLNGFYKTGGFQLSGSTVGEDGFNVYKENEPEDNERRYLFKKQVRTDNNNRFYDDLRVAKNDRGESVDLSPRDADKGVDDRLYSTELLQFTFEGNKIFKDPIFQNASFRHCKFSNVDFAQIDPRVFKSINFNRCTFEGCTFDSRTEGHLNILSSRQDTQQDGRLKKSLSFTDCKIKKAGREEEILKDYIAIVPGNVPGARGNIRGRS